MSVFLNTRGRGTLAVGICDRCRKKFPLDQLEPDPNSPGLMVCKDDRDELDPWRMAPRSVEDITLSFVRPDTVLDPEE